MKAATTRDRIVQAADDLFYRNGFEATSFGDIAAAVNLSRGNFYYHFKSKDEILDAVIRSRLAATQNMLDEWLAGAEHPVQRIRSFVHILIRNQAKIRRYGCPVGTLCGELAKLNHRSRSEASQLFTLFRAWLRGQFDLLGSEGADALAMQLLARTQGVATLASAFDDEGFIRREVEQMDQWLDACAAQGAEAGAANR